MTTIHRLPDPARLIERLSEIILDRARQTAAKGRKFALALAGGSTPEPLYRRLSQVLPASDIAPDTFQLFWGDERCVPLDDERSNYGMARRTWLSESAIPQANIHPVRCQDDPQAAADEYASVIRSMLPAAEPPRLDLILLGLGSDGHSASLFPDGDWADEDEKLVLGVSSSPDGLARVTFTPRLINAARLVAFLVTGVEKAFVVQRVIGGRHDPGRLPAQAIDPHPGELHWFLDAAAAQEL